MWPPPVIQNLSAWLQQWAEKYLLPLLKAQLRLGLVGILDGALDVVVLLGVPTVALIGSNAYMNQQYTLPRQAQLQIIAWAVKSDQVARQADIPSVTPLVLWYKEAGLATTNPDNCEGLMGLHDLIVSEQHPCFTPGQVGADEIAYQLQLGAQEFKKRCPQIRYTTTDPALIKRCYLAYNAGPADKSDPDQAAYVMNNYDAAHQNMLHGGVYRLKNLGAWPAHLSIESLILNITDSPDGAHIQWTSFDLLLRPLVDTLTRLRDGLAHWPDFSPALGPIMHPEREVGALASAWRSSIKIDCLVQPHSSGNPDLRPKRNPVVNAPVLTQDLHGCSYLLPGIDISSSQDLASPLQSPMPGQVTTYTDQWQNTTIRVENDEWVVTMLHPRSYLVQQGKVIRGQLLGVMGAQGRATGPHVHFSIYDKINKGYVDPGAFIPAFTNTK